MSLHCAGCDKNSGEFFSEPTYIHEKHHGSLKARDRDIDGMLVAKKRDAFAMPWQHELPRSAADIPFQEVLGGGPAGALFIYRAPR